MFPCEHQFESKLKSCEGKKFEDFIDSETKYSGRFSFSLRRQTFEQRSAFTNQTNKLTKAPGSALLSIIDSHENLVAKKAFANQSQTSGQHESNIFVAQALRKQNLGLPRKSLGQQLKTSRLFEITAGDRGLPLTARATTRPPKRKPVELESFNFVKEHYIYPKQQNIDIQKEVPKEVSDDDSQSMKISKHFEEKAYIFTSDEKF